MNDSYIVGVIKMPSKTFENLSKEKKELLIQSAIKEFSNHLYNEASINRIIKDANIPRGSFYMYFKDKEDLYFYLLEKHMNVLYNKILEASDKEKGDIFSIFESLFCYTLEVVERENANFLINIILNMDYLMEHKILIKKDCFFKSEIFLKNINKQKLNIKKESDLYDMANIIAILTIHKLIECIKHGEEKIKIKEGFMRQLNLLKEGFYKEEIK